MTERDTPFESPPAQTVEVVREGKAAAPADAPSADHKALASVFVGGVGLVCAKLGAPLTGEEKAEGTEKFALAIWANLPDTTLGPIVLAVSAGLWAIGTVAGRYVEYRKKKASADLPPGAPPAGEAQK